MSITLAADDFIYSHGQSIYNKRMKSRSKKSAKWQRRNVNEKKVRDIQSESKVVIKSNKNQRETQRKAWSKYNKKNKARNTSVYNTINDVFDGYESSGSYGLHDGIDSDDDHIYRPRRLEPIVITNESLSVIQRSTTRYSDDDKQGAVDQIVLKNQINELISKSFASYDLKYFPFAINSFDGQLEFERIMLDKVGVIKYLSSIRYLQRLGNHSHLDSYYYRTIDKVIRLGFDTQHLIYIVNQMENDVDNQFDADLKAAKFVVMNRMQLFDILYDFGPKDAGKDICQIIAEYTMNKKELLTHWKRDDHLLQIRDDQELTQDQYKHDGMRGIDEDLEYGDTVAKILNNRDMTSHYLQHLKVYREQDWTHIWDTLKTVSSVVWSQFMTYCQQQNKFDAKIKYNIIYNILLHSLNNLDLINQFQCIYSRKSEDKKMLQSAITETAHHCYLQKMFHVINESLSMVRSIKARTKDVCGIIKRAVTNNDNESVRSLCHTLKNTTYFLKYFDYLRKHSWNLDDDLCQTFWSEMWTILIDNGRDLNVIDSCYDLMQCHWKYIKNPKTKLHRFVRNQVIPDVADLLIPSMAGLEDQYQRKQVVVELQSKEHMKWPTLHSIVDMMRFVNTTINLESQCVAYTVQMEATNIERVSGDRYSRKCKSKEKKEMKKMLRSKYKKYGVKSRNKRIEMKMRKYRNSYLAVY